MRDFPDDQSVSTSRRVLLAEAKVFANAVVRHLQHAPGVGRINVAGSIRRRKETVGDLDRLVTCRRTGPAMVRLAERESVTEVLARGKTKMSVRLRNGLTVAPEASYGAMLQAYTGSKTHTAQLRRRAADRGLTVTGRPVPAAWEVGLETPGRIRRGSRVARAGSRAGRWPGRLLARCGRRPASCRGRRRSPCGDLHLHTTATDGRDSLEEMVHGAKKRGYAYIAITGHSQRVTKARGLDAKRLRQHWKAIDKLASQVKGIALLKGVELDILEDGRLDLPEDVLAETDWVVASIHFGQNQSREKITRRLLNAIRCPHVHAIGHPTGRLIGKRKGYEVDLEAIFRAAADHGCLLELNAQPDRFDLDDTALMAAKDRGVGIVVGTDAHSVEELGHMAFGVYQARRAGLEPGTWPTPAPWLSFVNYDGGSTSRRTSLWLHFVVSRRSRTEVIGSAELPSGTSAR